MCIVTVEYSDGGDPRKITFRVTARELLEVVITADNEWAWTRYHVRPE